MDSEERITELEIRIAHLESALQTLSDELVAERERRTRLDDELRRVEDRVAALAEGPTDDVEPPPPHY